MKRKSLSVIMTVPFLVFPSLLAAETRTWTNADGQTMEARIVEVEDDVVVFERDGRTYNYPIANLSDEDRETVAEWENENEAQSVVAEALRGNLVALRGSRLQDSPDEDLAEKRLFAFYYSASWCGPCRRFTPELVDFYDRVTRDHPEFELVFVSGDRDERSMQDYMADYGMSFPALRYGERREIELVNGVRGGSGIPNLVFVDGSGEIIARTYVDGNYIGPRRVLEEIDRYLN